MIVLPAMQGSDGDYGRSVPGLISDVEQDDGWELRMAYCQISR